VAAALWAITVVVIFGAQILGFPNLEPPFRAYVYPAVLVAIAVGSVLWLIRQIGLRNG